MKFINFDGFHKVRSNCVKRLDLLGDTAYNGITTLHLLFFQVFQFTQTKKAIKHERFIGLDLRLKTKMARIVQE